MDEEGSLAAGVPEDHGFAARKLLRAARAATLATRAPDGTPFASLVTSAVAPDGAALMLLSTLAAHTKHLLADPRCALMVVGEADGPNPQTAPRVTITGVAAREEDATLRQFWLAHHPYASLYAGFSDFGLWRLVPQAAHVVGGFARAATLTADALLPAPAAVQALEEAAARIIAHCNDDHADSLALLASRQGGRGEWRMLGVDCDGFDLVQGELVLRFAFAAPVADARGVRESLVQMLDATEAA